MVVPSLSHLELVRPVLRRLGEVVDPCHRSRDRGAPGPSTCERAQPTAPSVAGAVEIRRGEEPGAAVLNEASHRVECRAVGRIEEQAAAEAQE